MNMQGRHAIAQVRLAIAENAPLSKPARAEFTMLPQGDGTSVTWLMHGPAPFMAKIMHVFMNIDRMVGKGFETGLANLKRLTEK